MDSMRADLIRGLETSLPTTFDRERFFASLVSGEVDGAEEYLSNFTKIDSNYYSNLMFYLVKRQRYFKFLVEGDLKKSAQMIYFKSPHGVWNMSIPQTEEFISNDIRRILSPGFLEVEKAKLNGYTFDILPVANSFTDEMFTMMNQLIPMNPDLHKEVDISSQMQTLHLHDDKTTMLGVAGPAAVAFNGGEMNKDN